MNLAQFVTMLDTHGVRPERWPRSSRAEAGRLLTTSPQAAAALARAERFDRLVDEMAAGGLAPVGDHEVERLMGAVMSRLPGQGAVAVPARARRRTVAEWAAMLFSAGGDWGVRFAVSMVVAVCLGLVVGSAAVDRAQRPYTSVEMLTMVHSSYSSLEIR